MHPLAEPLCDACGEPLAAWRAVDVVGLRCSRCRRRPLRLSRCRSAGAYEGTLRAAIHGLKFEGRRSVAGPLSAFMLAYAGDVLEGAEAVVPVPLHAARQRQRGFNQAVDLAKRLGLPLASVLKRVRATSPQSDLPAGRRHANVRDAFVATRTLSCWNGAMLVLVDDVTTTGATLDACARVLLEGGAREVRAITAARAVRRQP